MTKDELIEQIKERATVYDAAAVCGVVLPRPGVKCRVPWRADHHPSGGVTPDQRRVMDWSRGDSRDAIAMVEELREVSYPVAVNLLAETVGAPVPFEDAFGRGRSRVLLEKLGTWPGTVPAEPEPVAPRRAGRADGGVIANFRGVSDEAADAWIRAVCANLAGDEGLQMAVAEWRGLGAGLIAGLAAAGVLGAVVDEDGQVTVWMPCKQVGGLQVRAQVRKVGPRGPGCEFFWPEKSEHKPGLWMARDDGARLVVGEGWGDVAAALAMDLGEGVYAATLGSSARKLEGIEGRILEVLILRQNEAGGDANERWARSIRALFTDVKVRSVFPPRGVKDWNDVVARHGVETAARLWADAALVPEDPAADGLTVEMAARKSRCLNDALAAEVFGELHRERFRHEMEWHEWGDGGKWEAVAAKTVMRAALQVEAQLLREADELLRRAGGKTRRDDDGRKLTAGEALRMFAKACGTARGAKNFLEFACTEPGISVVFDESRRDKMHLPVRNGLLDLRFGSRELWRPARRDDLVRGQAGVVFDEEAGCPMWCRFVESICMGDAELMGFLQRWTGYCLTGDTSEQKVLFLYGLGANGKSTFTTVLKKLLGDYGAAVPQRMILLDKMGQGASDLDFMLLRGARLALAPEIEQGARLAEAQLKQLSGSDELRGRMHYKQSESFWPTHKLLFFGNHKPMIFGIDDGIKRRFLMVHLRAKFEGSANVKGLGDTMWAKEAAGILNWAIAGCWEWQRQGLNAPQSVVDEVKEFLEGSDALSGFLADNVESLAGFSIRLSEVREHLTKWAKAEGEKWLAEISTRRLKKELVERGWEVVSDRKQAPYIRGRWKTESESEEDAPWTEE